MAGLLRDAKNKDEGWYLYKVEDLLIDLKVVFRDGFDTLVGPLGLTPRVEVFNPLTCSVGTPT